MRVAGIRLRARARNKSVLAAHDLLPDPELTLYNRLRQTSSAKDESIRFPEGHVYPFTIQRNASRVK